MQYKLLHDHGGQRTFGVILETGEETMETLKRFIEDEKVSAAQITAIGALRRATLAFFDWESKDYLHKEVEEQDEVASLIGDVASRRMESRRCTSMWSRGAAIAARLPVTSTRPRCARRSR